MMRLILGTIFSFPYVLLFYGTWLAASLARPIAVLSLIAVLSRPAAAYRKLVMFVEAITYLALCKDKKFKNNASDPAALFDEYVNSKDPRKKTLVQKKTLIFVRHGESSWNETFNKGDRSTFTFIVGFLPGLAKAILMEWYFWVTGRANDSCFYDAPLSQKGLRQAASVRQYLTATQLEYLTPKEANFVLLSLGPAAPNLDMIKNKKRDEKDEILLPNTLLVSSNLRRAIATMAVAFQDRLVIQADKTMKAKDVNNRATAADDKQSNGSGNNNDTNDDDDDDAMMILPCLQEISFNPDALSITPPYAAVHPASTDEPRSVLPKIYEHAINVTASSGNKTLQSDGLKRLRTFCRQVFGHDNGNDSKAPPAPPAAARARLHRAQAIIVGGHSLWFRSFFQTFLPHQVDHLAKRKKIANGGVVALTLLQCPAPDNDTAEGSKFRYMIDPASIVVLHGGF